jgi:hypothetical protein
MRINDAILALNPTVTVIRGDVAYDKDGNEVEYDKAAAEAEVQAKAYKAQRASAYPSIADQLDTLYHQGYDGWKATIEAVKTEFPKP